MTTNGPIDDSWWRTGDVCSECQISFCADHRPGNKLKSVDCSMKSFGTPGLLLVDAKVPLDGCWALDDYTAPGLGRTEVGRYVAAAKGYGDCPPDPNAARVLGRVLGKWLMSATHPTLQDTPLRTILDFHGVVPIPSPHQQHGSCDRMREVPTIIAEEIAYATGTSFLVDALSAPADAPQVKGVDVAKKPGLLRGVFSTDFTFDKGTRLLLIDDVVQSQATLSEATRVLKAAGAEHVTGIAAARAIWGSNANHGEDAA